jgi:hypothetical protein
MRSFDPENAVGGGLVAIFLDEVKTGAHDRGSREEGQQDSDNPGLKRALHGMRCRVPEANTSEEFRPNYCLFSGRKFR